LIAIDEENFLFGEEEDEALSVPRRVACKSAICFGDQGSKKVVGFKQERNLRGKSTSATQPSLPSNQILLVMLFFLNTATRLRYRFSKNKLKNKRHSGDNDARTIRGEIKRHPLTTLSRLLASQDLVVAAANGPNFVV
jgi:hypothetical protein